MATVKPHKAPQSEEDLRLEGNQATGSGTCIEHRPTIAERLAARQRVFFDGRADLSEQETRKKSAYRVVDVRYQARED